MRRKKSATCTLIIVVLAILIFFSILYMVEKNNYSNIFFDGTIINTVDCSQLTVEEAKTLIQKKEQQYSIELRFKDNENEIIVGSEIAYTINNLESSLEGIKAQQRKSIYFKGKTYNLKYFTYDKEKLKEILLSKKELQNDYMKEKCEIKYIYNPSTKLFESQQNAYYLDFDTVFDLVSKAIDEQSLSVSLEDIYSNFDNSNTLKGINSFINAEITYQLPNNRFFVLDADILSTWLVQDNNGIYIKDTKTWNTHIEDFVTNQLASLTNTFGNSNEFLPTGKNDTVLVEGGSYGYLLDVDAEIQKLKEDLENKSIISRKPCYQISPISDENYGLGKTYVEIDLSRQKVWVYVDGNLEIETDCVTGCINKGHETPTGIFTLTYKQENQVLKGAMRKDGTREYESFVNYWMPFNGDIGLHDATWRSSFGENIYISDGSHGCINLPFDAAKKLYGIINSDMPIIVYKSE